VPNNPPCLSGGINTRREREGDPYSSPEPASCMQQTLSLFSKEKTLNPAAFISLET